MVIALWIGFWLLVCVIVVRELSRPPKPAPPYSELPWFKTLLGEKPVPEPPVVLRETIPRTNGPWRRQREELQAQHNTKQKERDALTRPKPITKEKKPHDK